VNTQPTPLAPQAPQTPAQQLIGDTAPKLVELTDQVLFGDGDGATWLEPVTDEQYKAALATA
jgi:hypothetical protein